MQSRNECSQMFLVVKWSNLNRTVCRLNGREYRNVLINNVNFTSRKVSIEKISTEEKNVWVAQMYRQVPTWYP